MISLLLFGCASDGWYAQQAREKIPQQAFKLLKNKPLPNFENLCHAKWIVKYGYNAYAETKKSFFNPYGTPTGRVLSLGEKK